MIERLLPSEVVAVEAFGDDRSDEVFPGEEDLVAGAVPGRRREFVTARRCARDALARLGYPAGPIRPGPRREPRWPAGVVGSITHCAGYRAAVVSHQGGPASIGIDAEPHRPLPPGVLDSITAGADRTRLAALFDADPSVCWDQLLFSAKESIYKAWYPLTGRWLGFEDATLSIDASTMSFTGRLLVPGHRQDDGPALTTMRGRYLIDAGLVVTAVVVPG